MKILAISDLHITGYNKYSDFYYNNNKMLETFKKWESNYDLIVIAGDLYDLFITKWPTLNSMHYAYFELRKDYAELIRHIHNSKKIITVRGNHDYDMNRFYPGDYYNAYFIDGCYFKHGFYDKINYKYPRLAHFITWVSKILLSPILGKNYLDKLNKILWFLGIDIIRQSLQYRKAVKIVKQIDEIEFVIMGHTHIPKIKEFIWNKKMRYFINTGKFNGRCKNYVEIDTKEKIIIQNNIVYENENDLKKRLNVPGLVISTLEIDSFISKSIATVTNSGVSHTAFTIGNNRIIEQTHPNSKISLLDNYLDRNHNIIVQELKPIYRDKIKKIIKYLKKRIGKKYSYIQVFFDLLYRMVYWFTGYELRRDIEIDFPGTVCCEEIAGAIEKYTNKKIKPGVPVYNLYSQDFLENTELFNIIDRHIIEERELNNEENI